MATQAANEDIFRFEGYTLDLRRGCLHAGDREIELRPKSFEMLRYLVENAGRLVSKDELIKAVWPNVTVADDSLTRCVSDVRLAIGDTDQCIIKTLLRRGYLFTAPVSAGVAGSSLGPATTAAGIAAGRKSLYLARKVWRSRGRFRASPSWCFLSPTSAGTLPRIIWPMSLPRA